MGKIPQYQRNKFVSGYVGGSQVDTSGVELVEGLGKAVQAGVGGMAKHLQKQADLIIDQQANKAVLEYSLAYQRQARELEVQYAEDPLAFPSAITAMGERLMSAYFESIPDERVRARFGGAANTVLRQSAQSALNWAEAKQKENATIAAVEVGRLSAITTGMTTNISDLKANLAVTVAEINKIEGIVPVRAKVLKDAMPDMIESHMYNRIQTDPQELIKELKAGAYDNIPYYSAELKQKMMNAAQTRIRRDEKILADIKVSNYAADTDDFIEGTLTFEALDARATAIEEEDRLKSKHITQLKKSLISQIEANAANLSRSNEDANKYVDLIYNVFDNKVSRAKALEQIVDVYADGITTREEAAFLSQTRNFLKEEKTSRRSEGLIKAVEGIKNAVDKWWTKEKASIPRAQAFRELLFETMAGKDIDETAQTVINKSFLTRLSEQGIDVTQIPAIGARYVDGNGTAIWVYPDGTYKKE